MYSSEVAPKLKQDPELVKCPVLEFGVRPIDRPFSVNPMSSQMEVLLDHLEQPSQAYASSLVADNMRIPAMRPALAKANDPA